ncbi:MAG: CoA transferase [Deltaproteobacteria bacterium]|nr:CoA transferase [Deltaproteobacteria bacterium]
MKMGYPLEGIRVLALEQYIAGPDCTMWLADAGAEVIKIERPGVGDPRRNYLPVVEDGKGQKAYGGFKIFNRNKKSFTLNIQAEKGKEIYKELVKHADVVVENMAPNTVEKLGLSYPVLQQINPRLIYAAISGFGRLKEFDGGLSDRPAFDPVIQAMAGIMDQIGEEGGPPSYGFPGLADAFTSVVTGYAILLALFMREKTGEGQFIDSSMYDSLVSLNAMGIMIYSFSREIMTRGQTLKYQAPAGTYRVKDGNYVALIVANEFMWERFCKAIGRDDLKDDPDFAEGKKRVANREKLDTIVKAWMESRSREEVIRTFLKHGLPVGEVQSTEDLVKCPHLKARKMLLEIEDPVAGKRVFTKSPFRMTGVKEPRAVTAPDLGQHTEGVLKDLLFYSDGKIAELRREKVI